MFTCIHKNYHGLRSTISIKVMHRLFSFAFLLSLFGKIYCFSVLEFDLCKLTNSGSEYVGKFSQTTSNEPCQSWSASKPHNIPDRFSDETFPDGNKKLANNYCRNPDKDKQGPWCYSLNPRKSRESCKVPVCSNPKCRWTGIGLEYAGPLRESSKRRECSPWSTDGKLFKELDEFNQSFPEGNRMLASRGCRNPTEDPGGPWCFVVESEDISDNVDYRKEYCDIPFCFAPDGITVVDINAGTFYTHFTEVFHYPSEHLPEYRLTVFLRPIVPTNLPADTVDITFKLWAPGDWNLGELRIALSSLAVPTTGDEMRELAFGYEIVIRNIGATITRIGDETEISINEPGLLNGITWTNLTISRSHGNICVKYTNSETSLMLLELIEAGDTIIERQKFKYISFKSNVFMFLFVDYSVKRDGPFTESEVEDREVELEDFCPKHLTNSDLFAKYFVLRWGLDGPPNMLFKNSRERKSYVPHGQTLFCQLPENIWKRRYFGRTVNVGSLRVLNVYVRGFKVNIKLSVIPGRSSFPFVLIQISRNTCIVVLVHEVIQNVLAHVEVTDVLTGWSWSHFELSLSGSRLQLFMHLEKGIRMLHDLSNPQFTALRWFSVSSFGHAKWAFFCHPVYDRSLEPYPPECRASVLGLDYMGHQSITNEGYSCLPWASHYIHQVFKDTEFPDGTVARAVNYCRNPSADPKGPYCYAREPSGEMNKFTCNVANCTFRDCRSAGTGDDYVGMTNVTRSNKTCQSWVTDRPHFVEQSCHRSEGFPERSVNKARNYCRNPNRNVGGPWCYTTDHDHEKDLCNVPDCYELESCTVLVRGQPNHRVFIDPRKRTFGIKFKAKIWNPSELPELSFTFYPKDGAANMTFVMGAEKQQFLRLFFYNTKGRRALLKQFNFPHFLSTGRWTAITLMIREREFVAKYTDSSESFFTWKYSRSERYHETLDETGPVVCITPFSPLYFSYGGGRGKNDFIGLSFPCDDCHTELVRGPNHDGVVYYPMNLWTEGKELDSQQKPKVDLKIYLRGRGAANLSFYGLPSRGEPVAQIRLNEVTQDGVNRFFIFSRRKKNLEKVYKGTVEGVRMYSETDWTDFYVELCTTTGLLRRKTQVIGNWKHSNVPMYFFTVESWEDDVLWTATCDPPDISRGIVNGEWSPWSPWTCSASCGGGKGFRTRTCTNPRPSIYGESCRGDDIIIGACNNFPCGRISPYTFELLKEDLRKTASTQLKTGEGLSVKISCSSKRLRMIKAEEPTARIQWEKNAVAVAPEAVLEAVDEDDYSLTVSNVTRDGTGVYACMIHTGDGIMTAVEITTVVVATVRPIRKRIGQSLVLPTNAELLGKVYARLTVEWMHNSETYRLYDFDNDVVGNETIFPLLKEFEGTWECRVYQDSLGLTWTTNLLTLDVQPKPRISNRLLEKAANIPVIIKLEEASDNRLVMTILYVLLFGLLYLFVHLVVKKACRGKKDDTVACDDKSPLLHNHCCSDMSDTSSVCSEQSYYSRRRSQSQLLQ